MEPILIFYWKDRIDSFLAAHAVTHFLKNHSKTKYIGLSRGDTLPDLTDKFLFFFDIEFDQLTQLPDMAVAVNAMIICRYRQSMKLLEPKVWKLAKSTFVINNDVTAISRLIWRQFVPDLKRREVVMPALVKYMTNAIENPGSSEIAANAIVGLHQEESVIKGDVHAFQDRIVTPFETHQEDIIKTLASDGARTLASESVLIRKLLERNTMDTDFLGHRVKIAQIPEEFAHRAGYILAKTGPFAVIFEDNLAKSSRTYRLYSIPDGMDVLEISASKGGTGNAHYATFNVHVDFSNHRWT